MYIFCCPLVKLCCAVEGPHHPPRKLASNDKVKSQLTFL